MEAPEKNDRQLSGIIIHGLSLGFAVLIASLETLRLTPAGFAFELSWRTLVTFGLGLAVVLPCFKALFHSERRRSRLLALTVVVLIGLGSFVYPIRYVPREQMGEVLAGLAMAIFVLGCIGGILYLISRYLEADSKHNEFGDDL